MAINVSCLLQIDLLLLIAVLHSAVHTVPTEHHAGVEMADKKNMADWQQLGHQRAQGG
jgi:cell division protein FtsL